MKIETRKLARMPYAQAKVMTDGKTIQLWSYKTCVALIDAQGWLYIYGLYSQTTKRHIGAFMREYTKGDYYTAKQLFQDGKRMNIYTGQVLSR